MSQRRALTTVGPVDYIERGDRIRERRENLGMSLRGLADRAGVDRAALTKFERGEQVGSPEEWWVRKIERALDAFEQETGHAPTEDSPPESAATTAESNPGFIRFRVEGVYGAKALVVEGPVDNLPQLEAAVDRIMRRLAGDQGDRDESEL